MVAVETEELHQNPRIVITEKDLPSEVRSILRAERDNTQLLGGTDSVQAIFDAMPGIVARRLQKIIPSDFRLAEIEMKLALDFEIPGFKCGGDITIKLQPTK